MHHYAIFGGTLRSDLDIPELRPARDDQTPTWTLRTRREPPPAARLELLGVDEPDDTVSVHLFRTEHGFRLVFDDTGTFDVSRDGATIAWHPTPCASLDIARSDVIGRVLAVALHASGVLCLHGSSVAIGGHAVAFLAPKFHGKSTLALALSRAGARIATDDSVAIDLGERPFVRPGVHSVRVFGDSASRAGGRDGSVHKPFEAKETFRDLAADRLMTEPCVLDAVYILSPVAAADAAAAAERVPMASIPAALALIAHTKIGALLGGSEAPTLLARASQLARSVRVHTLRVVRDFDRLDEAVAQLMAWHADDPPPAAAAGRSA